MLCILDNQRKGKAACVAGCLVTGKTQVVQESKCCFYFLYLYSRWRTSLFLLLYFFNCFSSYFSCQKVMLVVQPGVRCFAWVIMSVQNDTPLHHLLLIYVSLHLS